MEDLGVREAFRKKLVAAVFLLFDMIMPRSNLLCSEPDAD